MNLFSIFDQPLLDGTSIPSFGFGCFGSHGNDITQAVAFALQNGYRYIDSAARYQNEADVGKGLRLSGQPRSYYYLISKVWPTQYDNVIASAEKSVLELDCEYLDCLLLHWPSTDAARRQCAFEQALLLKERGLVRSVGVSNFQIPHLQELHQRFGCYPVINEIEMHPFYQERELRQFCREQSIALIAYSPLCRGLYMEHSVIKELASRHGKTANQIVLRWHIQHQQIPIPKSIHTERIIENCDLFDFELSELDMMQIDALDCGKKRGADPWTFNG